MMIRSDSQEVTFLTQFAAPEPEQAARVESRGATRRGKGAGRSSNGLWRSDRRQALLVPSICPSLPFSN